MNEPTVTPADMDRLVLEVAGGDKVEWLDRRGIDGEAFLSVVDRFWDAVIQDPAPLTIDSLGGIVGFAFQLGYETAEQFPRQRAAA